MVKFKGRNIKIKENKVPPSSNAPKFILTYGTANPKDDLGNVNLEIVSSLIKDNDIFIEVNSYLLNIGKAERESCAIGFMRYVDASGLESRYRKTKNTDQSFFSKVLSLGKSDDWVHEIFVYVPNEAWDDFHLKRNLPECGVRYYICDGKADGKKILDDIHSYRMEDKERLDYFKLIVFDCKNFGSMGINTNKVSLADIKGMLEL